MMSFLKYLLLWSLLSGRDSRDKSGELPPPEPTWFDHVMNFLDRIVTTVCLGTIGIIVVILLFKALFS